MMRSHAADAGLRLSEADCEAVIAAYAAPQRRYHGLGHLEFLCAEAERHDRLIQDRALVRMAIWFHDAVYDATRSDNEALSANWARRALAAQPEWAHAVAAVIEMTANHFAADASGDAALFLDMDIAILGAPAPIYADYAAGVRAEYGHVDEATWRAGRGGFLQRALQRPHLFRTPIYLAQHEPQARLNLAAELGRLGLPAQA